MVLPQHFSTMGTFLLNELFYKITIVVVKVNRLLFKETDNSRHGAEYSWYNAGYFFVCLTHEINEHKILIGIKYKCIQFYWFVLMRKTFSKQCRSISALKCVLCEWTLQLFSRQFRLIYNTKNNIFTMFY